MKPFFKHYFKMNKKNIFWLIIIYCLSINISYATYISVRLIKTESSKCSKTPKLFFTKNPSAYTIATKEWYNGESSREIFFEIETSDTNIPIETIQIEAVGVKISRVLVGRTDVSYIKKGDKYEFTLVNDTSNGRHVQSAYQNPKGGPFLWIYHNSEERLGGEYLKDKYPAKALAASLNYEIACQEMLRLMGNMSGINQTFHGELILLGCESSAPRAHLDFPPHWHLQHWEHGHNKEYGINWREKQYIIPHYYLDSLGNITSNKQSVHHQYETIKQNKKEYFEGETCTWKDTEGNLIFNQKITKGTLQFILPNGDIWELNPGDNNAHNYVNIYKNAILQAKVKVVDDGILGKTSIIIKDATGIDWSYEINYDPFTGNEFK